MPIKAVIELEIWCADEVMKLHLESIRLLIHNYLRNQAYEQDEFEITTGIKK
jgi:hypothetical protein